MLRKLLLATACLASSAANANWQEASSRHFVVYSDDTPDHVRAYTERLERFDKAMRVLHEAPEDVRGASARVTVYIVGNVSEIQKLYGNNFAAGFYEARAGGSVAFTPRSSGQGADYGFTPQAILFHEYTHHWMLTNWSDAALPPWFVEGFAELHATAIFRNDGSVTFGAVPTYRAYTVGRLNLLPAERLLLPNPGKLDNSEQHEALYSRGWLFSHYLTFDEGRRKKLAAYIAAINSGKPPEEAAGLLGNVSGLDLKLNAYGKQHFLPSITIPKDQLAIGEVKVRELSAAEAAIMPARLLSDRAVSAKTAPGVVALARSVAGTYPNDAAVQNELAEAELDACDVDSKSDAACYSRSEAAADRAIAADPKSVHALIYKGLAQMGAARKNKETDPAKWATIRRWFLAANKVDSEAPMPLIQFYDSFLAAKQQPTKNAQNGLLYAYAIAPYDLSVRIRATQVLLDQGKTAQARVAIGPVAYNLDSPGTAEFAQKVLAAIDKNDIPAALAALKPKQEDKKDDKPKDGSAGAAKGSNKDKSKDS